MKNIDIIPYSTADVALSWLLTQYQLKTQKNVSISTT
ncbi:hypothetical protein KUCAC02_006076 [Chaenocephalus aceratus]|uniref:Uncharacterized protein n=1 Tax=Chaenocephalus aceratus TaxID=36190 RepID=A0ACB9WQF0_CHAAC|nr:hypothetical protein KUCAC02_006076 [Chaenocephalus aceratus]